MSQSAHQLIFFALLAVLGALCVPRVRGGSNGAVVRGGAIEIVNEPICSSIDFLCALSGSWRSLRSPGAGSGDKNDGWKT